MGKGAAAGLDGRSIYYLSWAYIKTELVNVIGVPKLILNYLAHSVKYAVVI